MDVWIFIAAAGSGYLAQFWQSFQSCKGASAGINDDDDDHPGSPSLTSSTRKCHYISSSKRKSSKLHVPELSQVGVTNLYLPLVNDSESWEVQVRGDSCTCPSTPKQSERCHDAAPSYSTICSNTSFRCQVGSSFNAIWPQKCCDSGLVKNKASSSLTGTFLDDCGCCMGNLYSEDLDSCINTIEDCCSIRCVKEKHENNGGNEVQAFFTNKTWRTGYYDQFQDVCALGSSDAHIMHACEVESGREIRSNQEDERGSGNSVLKMLLFNLGVGFGMMFAIMSNKQGKQQRIGQLEEARSALKGLEGEVQGRKESRLGFNNTRGIRESISPKQSCSLPDLVQKIFKLVEQVIISLVKNSASVSATECDCHQERARLEAELEVELERMEMDFNPGNATDFCGWYSRTNEDRLEMGNIVQGELSTRHIPCDVDTHSSTLDGSNSSSHEYINFGNVAVSPVKLAMRLYEVLGARQEEKILELEAEIKRLDNGLHAKERQFQAWKQRVRHLLQETACMSLSSLQKDFHVKAEITSMNALFSSTNKEDFSVAGLEHLVPFDHHNEDFLTNAADNVHSMNPSIPQPKTCCVHNEAYNKAWEGWLHPLGNTGDGSSSHLHDVLIKDAAKRDLWSNGMMMIHPEVVDISYGSVASGGSNNAKFDILGSSPCSVTSLDREIAGQEHSNNQFINDLEIETSNLQECFNVGEIAPCSGHVCRSRAQDVIDIREDNHGQCGRTSDLSTPEDDTNSTDLDEQLGQLLIDRIVRKGRKGSLIVEVAQSLMASFDFEDTTLEMGLPG